MSMSASNRVTRFAFPELAVEEDFVPIAANQAVDQSGQPAQQETEGLEQGKAAESLELSAIAEDEPSSHQERRDNEEPPAITQEALEAAKKEAFAQGRQEGLEQGREEGKGTRLALDEQIRTVLSSVDGQLADAHAEMESFRQKLNEENAQLILQIAKKVAGDALKEDPLPRIENFLQESMGIFFEAPMVEVRVHPDLKEALEKWLQELATRKEYEGKLVVESDEAMPKEDCKLEWKHGGAALNTDQMWDTIANVLETH